MTHEKSPNGISHPQSNGNAVPHPTPSPEPSPSKNDAFRLPFWLLLPSVLSIYALTIWALISLVPKLPVLATTTTLFIARFAIFPLILGTFLLALTILPTFFTFRLTSSAIASHPQNSHAKTAIQILAAPNLLLWTFSGTLIHAISLYAWLWYAPLEWIDGKGRTLVRALERSNHDRYVQ